MYTKAGPSRSLAESCAPNNLKAFTIALCGHSLECSILGTGTNKVRLRYWIVKKILIALNTNNVDRSLIAKRILTSMATIRLYLPGVAWNFRCGI